MKELLGIKPIRVDESMTPAQAVKARENNERFNLLTRRASLIAELAYVNERLKELKIHVR